MNKFCPNCGQSVADGTSFCPYCGVKVKEEMTERVEDQSLPVKPKKKKSIWKMLLIYLVAVLIISSIIAAIKDNATPGKPVEPIPESTQEAVEEPPAETEADKFVKKCMKDADEAYNEEVFYHVYEVLTEDMGCPEIHYVSYSFAHNNKQDADLFEVNVCTEDDEKCTVTVYLNAQNIIGYVDEYSLSAIMLGDKAVLWMDGNAVFDYSYIAEYAHSHYMSDSFIANLKVYTKEMLNTVLLSPSSAKYEFIGFGRQDDYVVVQGTVESDNAFGVRIVNDFTVELQEDKDAGSGTYKAVYIKLGDEVSGTYVPIN